MMPAMKKHAAFSLAGITCSDLTLKKEHNPK